MWSVSARSWVQTLAKRIKLRMTDPSPSGAPADSHQYASRSPSRGGIAHHSRDRLTAFVIIVCALSGCAKNLTIAMMADWDPPNIAVARELPGEFFHELHEGLSDVARAKATDEEEASLQAAPGNLDGFSSAVTSERYKKCRVAAATDLSKVHGCIMEDLRERAASCRRRLATIHEAMARVSRAWTTFEVRRAWDNPWDPGDIRLASVLQRLDSVDDILIRARYSTPQNFDTDVAIAYRVFASLSAMQKELDEVSVRLLASMRPYYAELCEMHTARRTVWLRGETAGGLVRWWDQATLPRAPFRLIKVAVRPRQWSQVPNQVIVSVGQSQQTMTTWQWSRGEQWTAAMPRSRLIVDPATTISVTPVDGTSVIYDVVVGLAVADSQSPDSCEPLEQTQHAQP